MVQGKHRAQRDDACLRMHALLRDMPQPDTNLPIAGRMTRESLTSPAKTLTLAHSHKGACSFALQKSCRTCRGLCPLMEADHCQHADPLSLLTRGF